MSSILYIASDFPLSARPNPHDKMLSVNEAIAAGVKDIPDFMLADSFDPNKPEVLLCSDREVVINVDDGTIEDGNFDDDFSVRLTEKIYGMRTEKKYCAVFDRMKYTPGRAGLLINYLREQLADTPELELWHTWLDDEPMHRLRRAVIPIEELTPEDIEELEKKEVFSEPTTDYCYCIVR